MPFCVGRILIAQSMMVLEGLRKERKKESRTLGSLERCLYAPSARLSQHLHALVSNANPRTEGQSLNRG